MKNIRVESVCVALIGAGVLTVAVYGQEKKESAAPPKIMHYGDLKWTPIIKGCDLAPVSGDPNAEGAPFVVRLRCVDGARIPAHWHPTDENVTVKGNISSRHGRNFRRNKTDNDERRELCDDAKGHAAFRDEQRRDHRAGSRSGSVQSELGESVRGATAGCAGSSGSETEILICARNSPAH
jgi:hypothetical protein